MGHRCAPAGDQKVRDALRQQLNRRLLLGLASVEAHIAWYPPGAGYGRHRDTFRNDDSRVLSLTCYLNAGWTAARHRPRQYCSRASRRWFVAG